MAYQKVSEVNKIPAIKLLLKGEPGTGKTWIAGHFPRPAIIDFENNTRCYLKKDFPPEICDEIVIINPRLKGGVAGGEALKPEQWWRNAMEITEALLNDDSIDTIVFDSLTAMCNLIFYNVFKSTAPEHRVTQPEFGDFQRFLISFGTLVLENQEINKNIVVIAHEVTKTDKDGGNPKLVLSIPTTLQTTFPKFFTDVWRTYSKTPLSGPTKYHVRTEPMPNGPGKCSLQLPADFEWSAQWRSVREQLSKA